MMDWNQYRDQVLAGVGSLGQITPDTTRGYATISGAGRKTNHLDEKTRELIAAACAITLRCDGCISVHTKAAREAGATAEELAEALGVAIGLNAGAALVYTTRAMDAFTAAGE
nr:carboxymuconolactone decarboxylase family protein [Sphingomonas kyeonggiensis]